MKILENSLYCKLNEEKVFEFGGKLVIETDYCLSWDNFLANKIDYVMRNCDIQKPKNSKVWLEFEFEQNTQGFDICTVTISEAEFVDLMVESAAIKDIHGRIWTLPQPKRHHDIIQLMRDSGYTGPVSLPDHQGFVLNNGMFCTRKQALSVAEKAKQIKNGKTIATVLTSEDLW